MPPGVQAARAQLGWQHATTDWREIVESPLIDIVDIVRRRICTRKWPLPPRKTGNIFCAKSFRAECQGSRGDAGRRAKGESRPHGLPQLPAHSRDCAGQENDFRRRARADFHFRARYAQDRLADPEFPLDWRLQKETSGGGVHSDINSHIIDLGRYLVGEFKEVCGLLNTFVPERPLAESLAKGQKKMGKVTAPDSAMFIGRMDGGVLANLEATRYAPGRKNHIEIEINGSKGSLYFDFEDMNMLKFYNTDDPKDRQGFREILVTARDGIHPYVSNWWPPGHGLGYEHTFVHAIADFVNACADGKSVQPTFEDGLKNQRVLAAVEESSQKGKWVKNDIFPATL
jgi:predicted dehydrogenase